MKLRTQLSLVSLLIFVLPWMGYYYVNDMAFALRAGAMQSLQAQAKAVAQRIESAPELLQSLQLQPDKLPIKPLSQAQQGGYVYVPTVNYRPVLDGYAEHQSEQLNNYDRLSSKVQPATMDQTAQTRLHLSQSNGYLHGFLSVLDADLQYFNPNQPNSLRKADYLRVQLGESDLVLRTSASGAMQLVDADTGKPRVGLAAYWLESLTGYNIEFSLPWPRQNQLQLTVYNNGKSANRFDLSLLGESSLLNNVISGFTQADQQISVTSAAGWLFAQQRKQAEAAPQQTHGLLLWLYKRLLRQNQFAAMPHFDASVQLPLQPNTHGQWYQSNGELVAVYRQAMVYQGQTSYVYIQQNSDALVALTSFAFSRLFFYSLLSVGVVIVLLVLYATWLSYRIRKLSKAATEAINEEGQLSNKLPMLNSHDELGDMARSFSSLLGQVQAYNDYLRSLADKLSHELRTPIAVMRGSLDNLQALNQQQDLAVYIDRAAEAGQRLSSMLNAMGAAKRLEDSLQSASVEQVPLHEMLQQLHIAYQQAYPEARFEVQTEPVELALADELIVQMLDKLVDNAVSFCPPNGAIKLDLLVTSQQAMLTVSNDGPLLPSGMEQQLFNSLVSKREHSNNQVHLGLGLYIVKLIAGFHDAEVSATNRDDGSGVAFTVVFNR